MLTPPVKHVKHRKEVKSIDDVREVVVATSGDVVEEAETDEVIVNVRNSISKLLKFSTFEPEHRYWLDTGSSELNATLGSKVHGLPYGKMYELSGVEHGGKTLISLIIGSMAQRDGAVFGYIDVEDSRDGVWATKLGVDWSKVLQIYPRLIKKKKDESPRLQSAEELFAEAEAGMRLFQQQGYEKQFWMVDSVAMLQTEMVVEAGPMGHNMRTGADRAQFLSSNLPTWAGLAANYNAMIFFVNQLRERVGMVFGDPTYTPGGRALRHCFAIRARVRRLKNGQLKQSGRTVGIIGAIKNTKNKAGRGSMQDADCGFKVQWNRPKADISFMPVAEAENLLKGE